MAEWPASGYTRATMIPLMIPLWSLFLGCGAPQVQAPSFEDHLSPWEAENLAPPVPSVGTDPTPEVLSVISGQGTDEQGEGLYWAHARGWVKADLAATWEALQEPEVGVDRREVDSWTVSWDTVPGFDFSYTIHNVVKKVITVRYDQVWVHELQEDQGRVVVVWDLVESPGVIQTLRGSAVLRTMEPGLTEIELIVHLQAALRDELTLESYARDLYQDLLATVHGRPLPAF